MSISTTLIRGKGVGINHYRSYKVTIDTHTIQTLVTASPSQVGHWLATNTRNPDDYPMIVGLDVECRPNSQQTNPDDSMIVDLDVEGRPNTPPNNQQTNPATLHLCVGYNCLLFQIIHAPSIPRALASFLAKPNVFFVGFGAQDHANILQQNYNLEVANAVDLIPLAENRVKNILMHLAVLATLGDSVLRLEVDRPQQMTMSDWGNRFLTHDQVQYAAIDAFISAKIGRALIN